MKSSSLTPPAKVLHSKTRLVEIEDEALTRNRVIAGDIHDTRAEAYRQLRSQVLGSMQRNNWQTLAITSAEEGAGKTLTAVNLAISISREVNQTVMLVDLDLRKPNVHTTLEIEVEKGIVDHLRHDEPIENILINPGYPRLVLLARKRLVGLPRKMKDEEDVALSALNSFFKAAEMGRFPDLRDQDDLWKLLCSITIRKTIDVRRYEERRPKIGESCFQNPANLHGGLHELPADEDESAFAHQMSEELEFRLGKLPPDLQQLAVAKLEGYSNPEISEKMGIALRTVERRIHLIRRKWESDS